MKVNSQVDPCQAALLLLCTFSIYLPSTLPDQLSWHRPMIIHPLNNMTYSLVKRKKASQLAVMLATPSHAIESVWPPVT